MSHLRTSIFRFKIEFIVASETFMFRPNVNICNVYELDLSTYRGFADPPLEALDESLRRQ